MGYYSDVGIATSLPLYQELQKAIEDIKDPTLKKGASLLLERAEKLIDPKTADVTLFWHCIKWYTGFPECSFITDFLTNVDDPYYYFCRIGEEIDDVEEEASWEDYPESFYLVRTLDYDRTSLLPLSP